MKNPYLFLILYLFLFSCSLPNTIIVELESKNSTDVNGSVVFFEEENKVTMVAEIENLIPGEHAIHLHEKSDCSSNDGKSTGGHWNPTLTKHGKWGDESGFHRGDIGNFIADKNITLLKIVQIKMNMKNYSEKHTRVRDNTTKAVFKLQNLTPFFNKIQTSRKYG